MLQCGMACHFEIRQVGGFALFTGWKDAETVSRRRSVWWNAMVMLSSLLLARTASHSRSARLLKLRKKVTLLVLDQIPLPVEVTAQLS